MGVGPPGADYRISPQTARRCVGISSQVVNGPGNGEDDSSGMYQEGERFAALAAGALTAVLVDGLFALTALRVSPGAHHLALIRTVALCAAALVLVFGGAH